MYRLVYFLATGYALIAFGVVLWCLAVCTPSHQGWRCGDVPLRGGDVAAYSRCDDCHRDDEMNCPDLLP